MTNTNIIALVVIAAGAGTVLYVRNKPKPTYAATPSYTPKPTYAATPSYTPTPPSSIPQITLDAALTPDEKRGVITALSVEQNAANLRSFADALEGNSPIAASLLKGKAALLGST